ncbi:unnamed protein product [Fraxinus pennsylvanica]|uniref:Epidermal patterning factor-like protein n=1 Tax=Fraxinus pennsylvanica TaxID=56036 RepID=A0AAD2EFR2_9LAMI|nr:unnamed protein product [Fraxinus pennsylvanica]
MKLTQKFFLCIFILFFSPSTIFSTTNPPNVDSKKSVNTLENLVEMSKGDSLINLTGTILDSNPPNCDGRCGTCSPCEPVLVLAPPPEKQVQFDVEKIHVNYYPQIWRCECNGNIYNIP